MKLRTETKHLLELSDAEVNHLVDEISYLPGVDQHQLQTIPTLRALRDALFAVRHGV